MRHGLDLFINNVYKTTFEYISGWCKVCTYIHTHIHCCLLLSLTIIYFLFLYMLLRTDKIQVLLLIHYVGFSTNTFCFRNLPHITEKRRHIIALFYLIFLLFNSKHSQNDTINNHNNQDKFSPVLLINLHLRMLSYENISWIHNI